MNRHVAVIDIGKTNAKLALVDKEALTEIAVITRPNIVLPGPPWPHFDVDGHWQFLMDGLREFQATHGVDTISITTHGACAALLGKDGNLAAPILDYEHSGPDEIGVDYDAIRPPFSETGSPRLAGGLNIGAQLFWQFGIDPDLKERTHRIVTYPQFWGARLTGVTAMDVTSLGCHTDLWNPFIGDFSSLAGKLGIESKLAPVRTPHDVLGSILPVIAQRTGLHPDTPVHCGIHDSNASLLPYVLEKTPPFSVISTGTWVIAMHVGSKPIQLDPDLDTLINVTALGQPAASARFMGGREHDLATGGAYPEPTPDDLDFVLSRKIMVLPSFAPETGPFKGQSPTWEGEEPDVGSARRGAAVGLYLALTTAECLSNIGHDGDIIVEGPFAGNSLYLQMLSVAAKAGVFRSFGSTGTSSGAAMLAGGAKRSPAISHTAVSVSNKHTPALQNYAWLWRDRVRNRAEAKHE